MTETDAGYARMANGDPAADRTQRLNGLRPAWEQCGSPGELPGRPFNYGCCIETGTVLADVGRNPDHEPASPHCMDHALALARYALTSGLPITLTPKEGPR